MLNSCLRISAIRPFAVFYPGCRRSLHQSSALCEYLRPFHYHQEPSTFPRGDPNLPRAVRERERGNARANEPLTRYDIHVFRHVTMSNFTPNAPQRVVRWKFTPFRSVRKEGFEFRVSSSRGRRWLYERLLKRENAIWKVES